MDDKKKPGGSLAKGLRVATLGAVSLLLQGVAPLPDGQPVAPILDRAREQAGALTQSAIQPLVMEQGGPMLLAGGHRSHKSHSSHRSHYSRHHGSFRTAMDDGSADKE